ncbi:MAG: efflux RND transporter permease subunit, partial [Mangrovibacterium sp.]
VREYDDPDSYIENNGKKALILSLEMLGGYTIVQYGKVVDEVLEAFTRELPAGVRVQRIADQPKIVGDSVHSFLRDLLVSIIVVILSMMVLFPFRSAVVAATTIPISIAITVGIMFLVGIPLNTVTLAALIAVLGMIVDNSIVVVDGYLEYVKKGMSRWNAAVASARNYAGSILLATLCISMIFFPLLFSVSGVWLDFLTNFPWTLSIALMVSFLLAMIYIPYMEYVLIRKKPDPEKGNETEDKAGEYKKRFNLLNFIQGGYDRLLRFTFRFPLQTILGGVVAVVLSMLLLLRLDMRMFPFSDRDQFAVEIFLPQGSSLELTCSVADSVYRMLNRDERVRSVTAFYGSSSPRFQATYAPRLAGKNFAQFIVNTRSIKETPEILDDYTNRMANHFPNAYVKFKQIDYQSVTEPIEVRLSGEDIGELKQVADTLMMAMRDLEELVWIHTDYEELQPSVEVNLNTVEAARLGIDRGLVQAEIAARNEGFPAGSVWEGDYPVAVILRTDAEDGYDRPEKLDDAYISTAIPGVSVPLRQVAGIRPYWQEGQIVRRNGVRTITVSANVKRGFNESNAFDKVVELMEQKVAPVLPAGMRYGYGGTIENDAEILIPVFIGIGAAIVLIFFFLLFNFKRIGVAMSALLSIFLCLPGTWLGLWITNTEMGLTSILGIISLMGIIVRNAIIMFDHAENLRINKKTDCKTAAYDAGSRRMVPIFLTSMTTAVGVVPMIISGSLLWAPMGIVIFSGTIVAMILVVTVLPVAYWKIFNRIKIKDLKSRNG